MSRRPAFTLIELLIVTAVFSLTALVATTVITRVQSTQRQVLGKQRVVADGRYVLESVARVVRQNFINYDYYPISGPIGAQTVLSTKDQLGVETCFQLSGGILQTMSGSGVTKCVGGTWVSITPSDLQVTDFHVYVTPLSDPFRPVPRSSADCRVPTGSGVGYDASKNVCACQNASHCYAGQACISTAAATPGATCAGSSDTCICQNANQQPEVTIYLATKTTNQAAGEAAKASIQTTVTSHLYRR